MPSPFPHHYDAHLLWGHAGSALITEGERHAIVGGAPPEFDGRPEWWSPEHLLLSAAGLCLMTTFQTFATRARLPVARYESHVEGTLDKTAAGLAFTRLVVHVEMQVEEADVARAEQLMDSAKRHCIVSNALKTPVDVEARVRALVPA